MRDRPPREAAVGPRGTLRVLVLACVLCGVPNPASGADAQAFLDRVIAAHGGMEAWVALKDLSFTLTQVALTPQGEVTGARTSLYRLKRHGKGRVETVTGDGLLIEGFDGERPWVTLNDRHLTEPDTLKRAHFHAVNWWYWMGIPFKMRDPDVILRQKEPATFQGKPVQVLEVTYAREGPTDRFTFHVDPETYRIVLVETELKPGVWPGIGGSGPSWSTWQEYRTAGPFVMHTKRTFYSNQQLTERRVVAFFGDLRFNTGLPDSLFRGP